MIFYLHFIFFKSWQLLSSECTHAQRLKREFGLIFLNITRKALAKFASAAYLLLLLQ